VLFAPDWCVPTDTRAMTKTGFKYQHELKIGEEILAFDPATQKTHWLPLKNMYHRDDYDGTMVSIRSYRRSIQMTPDHTCYIIDSKKNRRIIKAHELLNAHQIPRCANHDLPTAETVSDRLVILAGWLVTDGYIKRKLHNLKDGSTAEYLYGRIVQSKPATVEQLKALGLRFYSEKSKDHDAFYANYDKFTFAIPPEEYRELEKLGISNGLMSWTFMSKLTRRQLELLEETMMLGDGTGQHRFCGEEEEIFQMTLLRTLLGKPCTFYEQKQEGQHCWRTRDVKRKTITCANEAITQEQYEGAIWCPSVETGFWVAERDGLIFITGNTFSNLQVAMVPDFLQKITGVRMPFGPTGITDLRSQELLGKYWPAFLAITFGFVPIAWQLAIYGAFGDPDKGDQPLIFMNEEGRGDAIDITPLMRRLGLTFGKTEKRRTYLQWGKQAREVANWASDPLKTLKGKTSIGVKTAYEQITGRNTAGWNLPWTKDDETSFLESWFIVDGKMSQSRLAYIAQKFVPMTVQSWVNSNRPPTIFAPIKLGMSSYAAEKVMADVFQAYGDDGFRRWLSGRPERVRRLETLVNDTLEAAWLNGYKVTDVMRRAKSMSHRARTKQFFDVLEKNPKNPDIAKLEEAATALIRTGDTARLLSTRIKNKYTRRGRRIAPAQRTAMWEAWRAAKEKGNQ